MPSDLPNHDWFDLMQRALGMFIGTVGFAVMAVFLSDASILEITQHQYDHLQALLQVEEIVPSFFEFETADVRVLIDGKQVELMVS